MKNYPLGVQTFNEIRERNLLYIDKTKEIDSLLNGKYYFYARPRRFGKSLLLSTIKAIYEGQRELFKGLWIEDKWDWAKVHPVIHLGFNEIGHKTLGLSVAIDGELDKIADRYQITLKETDYALKFRELIRTISQKHGKVVLLIDEYDKPIIDYLGDEVEQAIENRDIMKSFYSVVGKAQQNIHLNTHELNFSIIGQQLGSA